MLDQRKGEGGQSRMNRERGPMDLFHAAAEREKEGAAKQHHIEMIAKGQINIFEVNQKQEGFNMLEQAIAKLKAEMEANKTNAYVQAIGQFLIEHVKSNPASAEKIMANSKTVAGSLDAMRKEAEKKRTGNFAILTPQEGFSIALEYFGIDAKSASLTPQQPVQEADLTPIKSNDEPQVADNTPKNKPRFEASFDDFL